VRSDNDQQVTKISRGQFYFIILQTEFGVGALSLPYDLFGVAKQDGWISLLAAGLLIVVLLFFFWFLAKRFPDEGLFNYMEKLMGRWLGKVFLLLYSLYFIMVSTLIVIIFSQTINSWVLARTPILVTGLIMALLGFYMAISKLHVIARTFVMLSFL
jgi:hypothetical protein